MLKFCTKNLSFKFGDYYFKQTNGVAMGSPLAPALAEVFLIKIESRFLNAFNPLKLSVYYRFVDDIFIILQENVNEIEILKSFNNFHPNLRFNIEKEQNQRLNFLDVMIAKINGKIITSWYRKPSNT